jgi:hypothetical protein
MTLRQAKKIIVKNHLPHRWRTISKAENRLYKAYCLTKKLKNTFGSFYDWVYYGCYKFPKELFVIEK